MITLTDKLMEIFIFTVIMILCAVAIVFLVLTKSETEKGSVYEVDMHYVVRVDDVYYKVIILRDGSHQLIQEPYHVD